MQITFMTANYVARQIDYNMTEGWMQGDDATNAYFEPVETYAERLDEYLSDVAALGFDNVDIWLGLLNWRWATDEHVKIALETLKKHNLTAVSLAGWFGDTPEDFEKACKLAKAMNIRILGGLSNMLETDYEKAVELLRQNDAKLAIENHPEKSPEELLGKIGTQDTDVLGLAVDTGWWGTHDVDAKDAMQKLIDRCFHIHLKDVRAPGGHETCKFGDGVVDIRGAVDVIKASGYDGAIAIEHEPDHYDPSQEVKESYELLKGWLAE